MSDGYVTVDVPHSPELARLLRSSRGRASRHLGALANAATRPGGGSADLPDRLGPGLSHVGGVELYDVVHDLRELPDPDGLLAPVLRQLGEHEA